MKNLKKLVASTLIVTFVFVVFNTLSFPVIYAQSDTSKPKILAKAGFGRNIPSGKTVINSSVTLKITDNNLKSATITQNGKSIKMPSTKKFTAAGVYMVTATDKARNSSKFKFTIKKVVITQTNLIPSYYNLIDFLRTKAFGGNFVTPASERSRVAALIKTYWSSITPSIQNTLVQTALTAQNISLFYASSSSSQKAALVKGWKSFVLSPNFIYAPLNNPKTYTSGSTISFNYPGDWTGGETTDANNVGWLFIGKNASESTWEKVMDTKNSPSGSLSSILPVTTDVNGKSSLEVARLYAKTFAPTFKEINHVTTTLGSVVVINGKFAGQSIEKFYWIVVIPSGTTKYSMSRMGGKVSESATLVPSFYNMLNTLNWSSTPIGGGGSGGGASDAFGTAWSRVSTAVVANIWAPSDNGGY